MKLDFKKYPKINAWVEKLKKLPGYKRNNDGAVSVAKMILDNLKA